MIVYNTFYSYINTINYEILLNKSQDFIMLFGSNDIKKEEVTPFDVHLIPLDYNKKEDQKKPLFLHPIPLRIP